MEPVDHGAEPLDEVPVIEPILRETHLARAGNQVDRRIGRQDAVEPLGPGWVISGLGGELQDEVGSQGKTDQGDRHHAVPVLQPGEDLAEIVAPTRVVDAPREAEADARVAEVDPYHTDSPMNEADPEPDHVRAQNLLTVAFARNGTVIPYGELLIEPDSHRLGIFLGVTLLQRIVTGENMDGRLQALLCARPCHGPAGHLR